jgi:hypothetical protein
MINNLNGMFGKVAPGMCRLSMNGGIAVKTSGGYKSYNVKTGRLTNCSNFVFDIGEDFFFLIPTNKVEVGDIILVGGKPKCVIETGKNKITVINYEDSTVDTILPERHVFMGSTYFYGKIVSMFGKDIFNGKKGTNKIMQYMMMSEMMKGNTGTTGGFGAILPIMMMNGGASDMFGDLFNFDDDEDSAEAVVEDIDETEDDE